MTQYIQLPPDSTGKKIRHAKRTDLYLSYPETNIPSVGVTIYGSSSGATGVLTGRHLHDQQLEYFLKSVTGTFQVGESLRSAGGGGGIVFSTITIVYQDIHQTQNIITDENDPDNALKIDTRGQASVRFAEGSPTMDAFGALRVSDAHITGGYEYSNNDQSGLFQDIISGGGSLNWLSNTSMVILSTDATANSSVSRTTNRYHFYQPGVGNLAIMTLLMSNAGVENNVRQWGYFEESTPGVYDGIFFELDGTTLNLCRSSRDPAIGITRIPKGQWSGDNLDGNGLSGMRIDLTKANFFWIDFAWLGVGAARAGIVGPDGQRWILHTFANPNAHNGPYMTTGTLPMRYTNFNKSTAPVSGSDMKLICSAIYSEAKTDYVFWRYADIENTNVALTDGTTKLVFNARPRIEVVPGKRNRSGIYPEHLEIFVTGGAVKLSILVDSTVTTPVWQDATSLAQYDTVGTISGGDSFRSFYVGTGVTRIDLSKFYETNDQGLHVLADASGTHVFTLVAKKLEGTTVNVSAVLGYRELN